MLTMLMPGTPIIYYGDEIMLKDISNLPVSSDTRAQRMRTLMQWNNSTNGGFQSCTDCNLTAPWVPANSDYMTNNVKVFVNIKLIFNREISVYLMTKKMCN